jgi:nitrate reductase delta subunit
VSTRDERLAWQCASLLLAYPDEQLLDQLDLLGEVAVRLPGRLGGPLLETVTTLRDRPLQQLQEDYVATFDTRRRCSLFLTYFLHGDTRKRGTALLRFRQAYLRAGHVLDDSELPDHLAVVLEYAATVDADEGRRMLLDHRAGLEVLRLALRDMGSPWAGPVAAVSATLPTLRGDERDVVRRLAAEGPPEEEVGLSPYGGPVDLPIPTVLSGGGAH